MVKEVLCQASGCNQALIKIYDRKCATCPAHRKAMQVTVNGAVMRFCGKCSRFHPLEAFDGAKKNCAASLVDHNRRQRRLRNLRHLRQDNSEDADTATEAQTATPAAVTPTARELPPAAVQAQADGSCSSCPAMINGGPALSAPAPQSKPLPLPPLPLAALFDDVPLEKILHISYLDVMQKRIAEVRGGPALASPSWERLPAPAPGGRSPDAELLDDALSGRALPPIVTLPYLGAETDLLGLF